MSHAIRSSAATPPPQPNGRVGTTVLVAAIVGAGLSGIFWSELWTGGGLIGGDLYTYYFPQKAYFSERLKSGEFPLWNDRVGHGFPLVAESQTGAFYPFHAPLYSWLDVNTAYNVVQLVHYVLAFVFSSMLARSLGLSLAGSLLAGLVYTYGWFPPRICLEWAIVGGAWLPAAFWCVERYLATRRGVHLLGLAAALAMQMLAGHFHLAFITQVGLVLYLPARLWWAGTNNDVTGPATTPEAAQAPPNSVSASSAETAGMTHSARSRIRPAAVIAAAVLLAYGLAAVQLVPTWELKQRSQRSAALSTHDPRYGYIPVRYWSQVVVPWLWYAEPAALDADAPPGAPSTNVVEAHLYFGLVSLPLMALAVLSRRFREERRWMIWLVLGVLALLYASRLFEPVALYVPGFNFFQGLGRYGVLTTLAAALLTGCGIDVIGAFWRRNRRGAFWMVFAVVFAALVVDFRLVSRRITFATIVKPPVISHLEESPVRRILAAWPQPVRLFCRGPNLATLLGVASTPPYLGLGPREYYDPRTALPEPPPFDGPPTPQQLDWLARAGVTHVLSFSPLSRDRWPVKLIWSGLDPFLNRAWGRLSPPEPFFLYEFTAGRGRLAWLEGTTAAAEARIVSRASNRIVVDVQHEQGGTLVLTELAYPGWVVEIDGEPAVAQTVDEMYRAVAVPAGRHRVVWTYRPRSIILGGAITAVAVLVLLVLALWNRRRHLLLKNVSR